MGRVLIGKLRHQDPEDYPEYPCACHNERLVNMCTTIHHTSNKGNNTPGKAYPASDFNVTRTGSGVYAIHVQINPASPAAGFLCDVCNNLYFVMDPLTQAACTASNRASVEPLAVMLAGAACSRLQVREMRAYFRWRLLVPHWPERVF